MARHHVFCYSSCDFVSEVPRLESHSQANCHTLPTSSFRVESNESGHQEDCAFDVYLQRKWCEAKVEGLFRYDLDQMKTRILPGKYNFVAQLNTMRATERRKPQSITNLLQPFNANMFNFTKANPKEILFSLENNKKHAEVEKKENLVLINVSPLEFCNSLLVPNISNFLPQVLDEEGLCQAVELVLLSSSTAFRIGFNSLCGYASVNHYHFHLFYLNHPLYLETVSGKPITSICFDVVDYAVPGFMFVMENGDVSTIAKSVLGVVSVLIDNNVPHNLFITRGARCNIVDAVVHRAIRIFVWPRKPCDDDKDKGAFNVACCEISGHLPIKDEASFETLTEDDVVKALRETCFSTYCIVRPKVITHLATVDR